LTQPYDVRTSFAGAERYDAARHDVTGFDCGNELLEFRS